MFFVKTAFFEERYGVTDATLRTWYATLENAGYVFKKSGKNRNFDQEDIEMMDEFVRYKASMTVEEAAHFVVQSRRSRRPTSSRPAPLQFEIRAELERMRSEFNSRIDGMQRLLELSGMQ
jgi:hypothetical protein